MKRKWRIKEEKSKESQRKNSKAKVQKKTKRRK